jgi:hypothetical protein
LAGGGFFASAFPNPSPDKGILLIKTPRVPNLRAPSSH